MSATTSQPPLPRQSIGTTFVVAMSVLGFVAALQVCAVLWHYSDIIQQQVKESATTGQPAPQATPVDSRTQVSPMFPAQPTTDAQKIEGLFAEVDRTFRLGDFDASLRALDQLEMLSPGDPKVLLSKAQVLEKLDQSAEAAVLLEEILKIPGLPAEYRSFVTKKLDQIAESLGSSPGSVGTPSKVLQGDDGTELRNESGIRAGATLGIVDVRVKDGKRGMKTLNVAVKSLPNAEIVGEKVKILAYFYEETEDGEVVLTEAKILSQWMSPPIDWAENEPELLELQYALPDSGLPGSAGENGALGRKYVGYIVGLFYKGELQDFRSDPAKLAKDHPLPLDDTQ